MRRSRCRQVRARAAGALAGTLVALAGFPDAATGQGTASSNPSFGAPSGLAGELRASSSSCCLILLYPVGARRAAMSDAVTTLSSADAVLYNPAGVADLTRNHFALHHVESELIQIDAFTLLFTPFDLATFGVTYQLIDHGDQDITGDDQVPVGRLTTRDHVLIATFATPVASGLSAGLNYKFFNERYNCSGQCGGAEDLSAATHGLDFGLQYRPGWLTPVRFGAALLDLGFPLQVVNNQQADPMPTRIRIGASYDVMRHIDPAGIYELWVLVDAEESDLRRPTSPRPSIGLELSAGDVVFLRAGYGAGEGLSSGTAVGVGLVYSSFNIAVAKQVGGGLLDDPFQFSVDVGF